MPCTLAEFRRPIPPWRPISDCHEVNEHYVKCRKEGTSHNLAEMFAFQHAPAIDTADTFISGMKPQFQDENDEYARQAIAVARAHGVNVRRAHYCSQLADFPFDPEAWVTSKDDVKRVAGKKNLKIEGSGISYTPPAWEAGDSADAKKPYMVADDIVESEFAKLPSDVQHQPHAKEDLKEKLSGRG